MTLDRRCAAAEIDHPPIATRGDVIEEARDVARIVEHLIVERGIDDLASAQTRKPRVAITEQRFERTVANARGANGAADANVHEQRRREAARSFDRVDHLRGGGSNRASVSRLTSHTLPARSALSRPSAIQR